MTGKASFAARDGSMARCHPGLFIGMAAEAEFVVVLNKQSRVRRGVRIMAGKAHAVLERSMHDAAAGLEGGVVMAHNAERFSVLNGFKGLRR
jgi:hypothetical protein